MMKNSFAVRRPLRARARVSPREIYNTRDIYVKREQFFEDTGSVSVGGRERDRCSDFYTLVPSPSPSPSPFPREKW